MPSKDGDTVDSTTSNLRSTSRWREVLGAFTDIFGSVETRRCGLDRSSTSLRGIHRVPHRCSALSVHGAFGGPDLRIKVHGPTGQLTNRLNFGVLKRPTIGL